MTSTTTWDDRLESAQSVDEVLAAARDFLARFDPQEVAAIPARCRPPAKIIDADDIGMYAYDLVRYECDDAAAAQVVHQLAQFFSHASMHVSRLLTLESAARVARAERGEEAAEAAPQGRERLAR